MSKRTVVGIHSVEEVLKVRPKSITQAYVKKEWEKNGELILLVEQFRKRGIAFKTTSLEALDKVCSGHQGVSVEVKDSPEVDWNKIYKKDRSLVILLDGIEDPQNLGSILRTSWLMDVDAIVIPKNRAVGLSPAVCKVASGGAEHIPVEEVNQLSTTIAELKENSYWVYGLAEAGEKETWDVEFPQKTALVIGAEEKGLKKATMDSCDDLLRIYQVTGGSSYNASVAAAMTTAEVKRQQLKSSK